ncbi:uncharacterized protein [Elaeis guineensis]|uniref:uncharacterized protein n=1 Tax=Elaeis guineensis var. tenera TaxID=51953 RepID=UPI003C6D4589
MVQGQLKEGDCNTSFFHKVISGRKRKNCIISTVDDGVEIQNQEMIASKIHLFAKTCLGALPTPRLTFDWNVLYSSPQLDLSGLDDNFSMEEIKKAVFSLGNMKVPEPDCSTFAFFKRFWNLICDDLMVFSNEFHKGNLDLSRLNYVFISLMSKKEVTLTVQDLRSTS